MGATTATTRLVLASSSPRRRQLLAEAGYAFDAVDSAGLFVEGIAPGTDRAH